MTNRSILLTALLPFLTVVTHAQEMSIYISDAGNFNLPPWQILKFDANGENGEVFIDDHLDWPQDIVFLEDQNVVLISNLKSGQILRFNARTGDYIDVFAGSIGGPTRMKIGVDSLLYVLQWTGNGNVWRYTLTGNFVDEFTHVGIPASIGLDWDAAGNLYVSSYTGKYVQKFSPTGEYVGKFISTNLAGPTNILFDDTGDLLVNDYNAGNVKRFDSSGNFKGVFISNVPKVEGVDFLPNGNVLLGVGGTSSVASYDASGNFLDTIVSTGSLDLKTPNAVVIRQNTTTAIPEIPTYIDANIVTPSFGTFFQFTNEEINSFGSIAEVSNASGVIVRKINIADSTFINAFDLPDGIYFITMPLQNNSVARQKIMVQH